MTSIFYITFDVNSYIIKVTFHTHMWLKCKNNAKEHRYSIQGPEPSDSLSSIDWA